MTAIVAVLNKHAVAIAADSAATISSRNNKKVFNTANKVFTLSKYHPVAVAIYNNSELVGVPWEIVIKEYRKALGEKTFATLKEYVGDFFNFIKRKNYFTDEEDQKKHLKSLMLSFLGEAISNVRGANITMVGIPLAAGVTAILDNTINTAASMDVTPAFKDVTKDSFEKYAHVEIDEILNDLSSNLGVVIDRDKMATAMFYMFTRIRTTPAFSGIVFCGYGEKEVFPSLYSYMLQHVIEGNLSVLTGGDAQITMSDDVAIMPFAQIDVMQTLIDGIAPIVKDIYFHGLADPIKALLLDISKQVRPASKKIADNIDRFVSKGLQKYINDYIDKCDLQRANSYTTPLVNSVSMLEKEDLADFSESLIGITSVKRKMSLNEQNTVGGPIDVLVLSKGDGAIWMKRKHYFDPDLNPNFFDTYLKH